MEKPDKWDKTLGKGWKNWSCWSWTGPVWSGLVWFGPGQFGSDLDRSDTQFSESPCSMKNEARLKGNPRQHTRCYWRRHRRRGIEKHRRRTGIVHHHWRTGVVNHRQRSENLDVERQHWWTQATDFWWWQRVFDVEQQWPKTSLENRYGFGQKSRRVSWGKVVSPVNVSGWSVLLLIWSSTSDGESCAPLLVLLVAADERETSSKGWLAAKILRLGFFGVILILSSPTSDTMMKI